MKDRYYNLCFALFDPALNLSKNKLIIIKNIACPIALSEDDPPGHDQ